MTSPWGWDLSKQGLCSEKELRGDHLTGDYLFQFTHASQATSLLLAYFMDYLHVSKVALGSKEGNEISFLAAECPGGIHRSRWNGRNPSVGFLLAP